MDAIAYAYKEVRDATLCNEALSSGDAVAVLELVKYEIVRRMQRDIDDAKE